MHVVRLRTSARNRIFGLLTQSGLRSSLKRLRAPDAMDLLAARGVEETWRRSIAEALAIIDLLDARIAPLDAELRPLAAGDPRVLLLRTIPGLGDLLRLTFAAEIGDVSRFSSPRKPIGGAAASRVESVVAVFGECRLWDSGRGADCGAAAVRPPAPTVDARRSGPLVSIHARRVPHLPLSPIVRKRTIPPFARMPREG